jgi:hypothetical protein
MYDVFVMHVIDSPQDLQHVTFGNILAQTAFLQNFAVELTSSKHIQYHITSVIIDEIFKELDDMWMI